LALNITATFTIDCDDISCPSFVDTTGGYSLSNTSGYGSPNLGIDQIVSITFVITDENGDDWTYSNADYLPNSAGNSSICLTGDLFTSGSDTLTFVAGQTYSLFYTVSFDDDSDITVEQEFTFPCCGSSITSNLGTNFSIQQNIGCQSLVFADVTGAYNASTNTGGYGTPNPSYADIDSTLITFEFLGTGGTAEIDSFIPTGSDFSIVLNGTDLGFSNGTITDQLVKVTYQVFAAGDCQIGFKSSTVLFYCQTQACINAKIASSLAGDCACDGDTDANTNVVWEMMMELESLKIVATKNASCIDGKIETLYQKCTAGCSNC
jgi:hypothetical protein